MPLPRRAVVPVVLGACAVAVGLLAGLSIADPFHLRYARWFSLFLVFLTILLVGGALTAATRGIARGLVVAVGVLAAVAWAGLAWFAVSFSHADQEVSTVVDGGRRLVVLQGAPLAIDAIYAVVVRSGSGPFEQESLVYQGPEEAPPPFGARFVDGDTVELRTFGGCLYRSDVSAVTLEVTPVHIPLQAGTCQGAP